MFPKINEMYLKVHEMSPKVVEMSAKVNEMSPKFDKMSPKFDGMIPEFVEMSFKYKMAQKAREETINEEGTISSQLAHKTKACGGRI